MTSPAALHASAERRKRARPFAPLVRSAAAALAAGRLDPLAEAIAATRATPDDVLFMARVHGLSGRLAALAESAEGGVPAAVLEALASERSRTAARGARLADDLAGLARRAARAGLPFAPLKGSVLAFRPGGDPSARPMADLDLLAPHGTFDAWSSLLRDAGYRPTVSSFKNLTFRRGVEKVPVGFGEDADHPRPVELHGRIRERFLGRVLDVTAAYESGLADARLLGEPARLPDAHALTLHLLLHAAPAAAARGLRLVQAEDLRSARPTRGSAGIVGRELDEIGAATALLVERAVPGVLDAAFLEALAPFRPPPGRLARWLARPGIDTGEASAEILAFAQAPLCRSAAETAARLLAAWPERAVLEERYGAARGLAYPGALARYVRDRLVSGWRDGKNRGSAFDSDTTDR